MKMLEYMEFELFRIFREKLVAKTSTWILGYQTPNYLCSVMSLVEEKHKCSEPDYFPC